MSVGARLARAREQRGLSVDQVAALTNLRVSHITKIESDDFVGVDAEVFIRAHLRLIAVAVGEDPADILREYTSDGPVNLDPSALPQNEVRDLNIFERRKTEALPKPKNFTVPLIIAAIVLFIGVLIATQSLRVEEMRANPSASASESSTPSKSPTAEASPSEPATSSIDPSLVTVTITSRRTSWLRVLASSGEELFQRNLVAGESFTFTDLSSINVRVGFPPGLDFSINGVFVGPLGDGSSVVDQTFVVGQTEPLA